MEAPKEFRLTNTLVNPEGYLWSQPQAELLSHKRYVSVVGEGHTETHFQEEHLKKLISDRSPFGKKKGLLSDFMDHHGWKKGVDKLMGFERSQESRTIKNTEIDRMKQRSSRSRSTNRQSLDHSLYDTVPVFLAEKNRIRAERNSFHDHNLSLLTERRLFKRKVDPASIDAFIDNKEEQYSSRRLEAIHSGRPFSQNHRTVESWMRETGRASVNPMNGRSNLGSLKKENPRSTMDEFNSHELDEFESKFMKNGTFRATRNNDNNKLKLKT